MVCKVNLIIKKAKKITAIIQGLLRFDNRLSLLHFSNVRLCVSVSGNVCAREWIKQFYVVFILVLKDMSN